MAILTNDPNTMKHFDDFIESNAKTIDEVCTKMGYNTIGEAYEALISEGLNNFKYMVMMGEDHQ